MGTIRFSNLHQEECKSASGFWLLATSFWPGFRRFSDALADWRITTREHRGTRGRSGSPRVPLCSPWWSPWLGSFHEI